VDARRGYRSWWAVGPRQQPAERSERDARIEDAGKLGACCTTRTNLIDQVIKQNGALADLRGRAEARAAETESAQADAHQQSQAPDSKPSAAGANRL
jgi:hypothetical protein